MVEVNGLHMDDDAVRRFASKIRTEGNHWRYIGNINNAGITSVEGEQIQTTARRVSWAIANGGIEMGRRVRATCDCGSWCINPSHLEAEQDPEPEVARRFGLA